MIDWLSGVDWVNVLTIASFVVAGASATAAAIAPLTKTKADDKLAGWLSKAKKALDVIGLNTKKS